MFVVVVAVDDCVVVSVAVVVGVVYRSHID